MFYWKNWVHINKSVNRGLQKMGSILKYILFYWDFSIILSYVQKLLIFK